MSMHIRNQRVLYVIPSLHIKGLVKEVDSYSNFVFSSVEMAKNFKKFDESW